MANPDDPLASVFIATLVQRTQSGLRNAGARISHANDLSSVIRLKSTAIPSLARSLLRREINALEYMAEDRAKTIVKETLASLERLGGEDQAVAIGRARQQFMLLRGHFPRLSAQADRHISLLCHKAAQEEADPQIGQAPPRERP